MSQVAQNNYQSMVKSIIDGLSKEDLMVLSMGVVPAAPLDVVVMEIERKAGAVNENSMANLRYMLESYMLIAASEQGLIQQMAVN